MFHICSYIKYMYMSINSFICLVSEYVLSYYSVASTVYGSKLN